MVRKSMANKTIRTKIFVSYSHVDKEWLRRLQVHLKPLVRQKLVDLWDDTRIDPGQKWRVEIKQALDSAAVAILLLSADFLASDFISANELPLLLSAAAKKDTVILPVIVSPCRFSATPILSEFQAFNPESEPLNGMTRADYERKFVDLANRVSQLLGDRATTETITEESIEEESTEEAVFHPAKKAATRGEIHKCQFYISPFYQKTTLWTNLADVLVVLHNSSLADDIYLIPSGFANPHLSDAGFLRAKENKEWLARKRQATIEFVKKFNNRLIDGGRFSMKTRTRTKRTKRTKVYSLEYDKFLNAALSDLT